MNTSPPIPPSTPLSIDEILDMKPIPIKGSEINRAFARPIEAINLRKQQKEQILSLLLQAKPETNNTWASEDWFHGYHKGTSDYEANIRAIFTSTESKLSKKENT